MRQLKIFVILLSAVVAGVGQTAERPLAGLCEVVSNPKRYHKKVVYVTALLDAHVEGAYLRVGRGCAAPDGAAFAVDEDFTELNDFDTRGTFDRVLNPLLFIPAEHQRGRQYSYVVRTEVKLKGYLIVSGKRQFGRFGAYRFLLTIRQIQEIGEPRLIEVNSKEFFDGAL